MKKSILSFLLVGLLALTSFSHAATSGIPGGISVGKSSLGTYSILTGVTEAWQDISLTSILSGTNGTTALADTAITTDLYVANPTGLSLSAGAVIFPSQTDGGIARLRVPVPLNYASNPRLILAFHTSTTFSAGTISITASAVQYPLNGATNTALVTLGAIQLSTTAGTRAVQIGFPVGVTLVPGSILTYHVFKTGVGGGASKLELVDAKFGFHPSAVFNGQ